MKERARNVVFFLIHFIAVAALYTFITLMNHHSSNEIIKLVNKVDSLNVVTHKLNKDICTISKENGQYEIVLSEIFKKHPDLKKDYGVLGLGEKK
jgi:hypothetical protein